MTSTLVKLPGEPIVHVAFEGTLGIAELEQFIPAAVKLQAESNVPLYWIIDVVRTKSDFAQIMQVLGQQSRGTPGTASNAPGRVFMVGSAHLTRLYVEAMRQPQYGNLDLPMFSNPEDALAAVRILVYGKTQN